MIKNGKTLNVFKRCFLVFLVVLMVTPITAFADDDSGGDSDVSLYTVASAAGAYYDAASANIVDEKDSIWTKWYKRTKGIQMQDGDAKPGNAGGMLGYVDPDKHTFLGWAFSQLSQASQVYSYSSLTRSNKKTVDSNGHADKNVRGDGFSQYAYYGYALQEMGFDSTANENLDINAIGRRIGGGAMIVAYSLTSLVNGMFGFALKFLSILNPFRWFADADNLRGASFITGSSSSALQGIQNFVSGMYDLFYEWGVMITLPLTLAFVVFAILVLRKPAASKLKTYFIRAVFIVAGIPLLASLYTAALNSGMEAVNGGALNTNYIIMSTFVDFESWASRGQLAVPKGAHIDVVTPSDTEKLGLASSNKSLRDLARRVNEQFAAIDVDSPSTSLKDDSLSWNQKAISAAQTAETDANTLWSLKKSGKSFAGGINIITRFMNSSYYHASDYETEWKASLEKNVDDENFNESNVRKLMTNIARQSEYEGGDFVGSGIFASGGLTCTSVSADNANGQKGVIRYKTNENTPGLSPLSMYNYLNSSFSDSSVTVYSTNRASSALVRESHHSVNIIGTGVMSFLYFLDTLSMLYCMVVIGIGYAFTIILGSIKRGIRIIMSVPAAMLGSLKAISRIITVTCMMIVNALVTLFMYEVVQVLLVGLMGIVEDPFNTLLSNMGVNRALSTSTGIALIFPIISLIMTIAFTIIAMRLRKKVVRAADEALGNMIDRVFGPSGVQPEIKGPGMVSKAAGAVASGAGMALGGKLMDGTMGKLGTKNASISGVEKGDGASAGSNAGTDIEAVKNAAAGSAQNPTGNKSDVEVLDGNAIQGAEKQQIVSGDTSKPAEIGGNTEADGRRMLAENAESLSEMKNSESNPNGNEAAKEAEKIHASEDIQSEARKDKAKGAVKGVTGAVEAGVGAYTGNTDLVKRGAENMTDGTKDVKAGASKDAHADEAANEAVEQKYQQKSTVAQETDVRNKTGAENVDATKNIHGSTEVDSHHTDNRNVDKKTSELKADNKVAAKSRTDVAVQSNVKKSVNGKQTVQRSGSGGKVQQGSRRVQTTNGNRTNKPANKVTANNVKKPTESVSTPTRSKVPNKSLNGGTDKVVKTTVPTTDTTVVTKKVLEGAGVGSGDVKKPDVPAGGNRSSDFIV